MTTAEPERGAPAVAGLARTRDEAQLFLDLRPCERCGSTEMTWESALVFIDGRAARSWFATCPACGLDRKFTFWAPDPRALPSRADGVAFGDEQPSGLVDAGQWLWVADLVAQAIPGDDAALSSEERAQARFDLRIAAAAVAEAAKFLPGQADAVPVEALWTDRGLAVYREEPARFGRLRLETAYRAYRELADRLPGA